MKTNVKPVTRPPWPRLPARLVADLLAGHSAIGLAFGALIYLVCLTGTIAVFVDEMKLVEAPSPTVTAVAPGALNRALDSAIQLSGGSAKTPYVFITAPTTPRQRWAVLAAGKTWRMNAHGGLTPVRTPFTDFVTDLHMTLLLPAPWGAALVGVIGAALLSLILSGVLAHPRILRDAFMLRLGGARRLQEADLHNRLSVWGLPFHLAVTLSGAFFGLSYTMLSLVAALGFHGDISRAGQVLQGAPIASDTRPADLAPLDGLIAQTRGLQSRSTLSYIEVERPDTRGARISIEVTAPGRLPRGEQAVFDNAGALVGRGRFASGPLGLQAYSGAAQLHFGFFGGLPVRLAYGMLGAALTYISASGVTIYLIRRRDRGRPAPRLERAWLAWTWGAPAALLLAAALSHSVSPAACFWATAVVVVAASVCAPRTRRDQSIAQSKTS